MGLSTSQPFHSRVMRDPSFLRGEYDIGFLERVGDALLERILSPSDVEEIAVAAALAEDEVRSANVSLATGDGPDAATDSAWLRAARRAGLRWR